MRLRVTATVIRADERCPDRPLHALGPGMHLRPLDLNEPSSQTPEPEERWSTPVAPVEPQVIVEPAPDDGTYRQMLTRVLEVLDGRRPVGQLRTLLAPSVFEATLTRLRMGAQGVRYQLQSVHSCRPSADAVELCARITTRGRGAQRRSQALVVRLERHRNAWRCVFLRILQ